MEVTARKQATDPTEPPIVNLNPQTRRCPAFPKIPTPLPLTSARQPLSSAPRLLPLLPHPRQRQVGGKVTSGVVPEAPRSPTTPPTPSPHTPAAKASEQLRPQSSGGGGEGVEGAPPSLSQYLPRANGRSDRCECACVSVCLGAGPNRPYKSTLSRGIGTSSGACAGPCQVEGGQKGRGGPGAYLYWPLRPPPPPTCQPQMCPGEGGGWRSAIRHCALGRPGPPDRGPQPGPGPSAPAPRRAPRTNRT